MLFFNALSAPYNETQHNTHFICLVGARWIQISKLSNYTLYVADNFRRLAFHQKATTRCAQSTFFRRHVSSSLVSYLYMYVGAASYL